MPERLALVTWILMADTDRPATVEVHKKYDVRVIVRPKN